MQDIIDSACCNKSTTSNTTMYGNNTLLSDEEEALMGTSAESALPPPIPLPVPTVGTDMDSILEEQRRTGIARIQLSFELDDLKNTRAWGFLFHKGRDKTYKTCPYILVTTIGDDNGGDGEPAKIGKTETYVPTLRLRERYLCFFELFLYLHFQLKLYTITKQSFTLFLVLLVEPGIVYIQDSANQFM